jgi:EAL domain-containing protein (putative c-di-GMP-specific phosphodiesterase class I)
MAGKLDIDVVAEGVEKPRQIEFLRKLGCDVIQGYVFSRPVPPAEFLRVKDRRFT